MRPISASLSPNTQADDVVLAILVLCSPWIWQRGHAVKKAEEWFQAQFPGAAVATSFNSGRSALLCLLQAFGVGQGDEVLVQAFTCVAVANSVLWAGAIPIFVDIDKTFNVNPDELEKKTTKKTKAIIVQHTLGIPADMDRILSFAKKNNLIVIEDCAHSLGAQYKGKPVGGLADASFFSFGRDKVVSSVFGGMALVSSRHKKKADVLLQIQQALPKPRLFWVFQQLLHPIIFSIVLPLYTVGLGKVLLYLVQKLGFLSFPVYREEKDGGKPRDFPAQYPNGLAILILKQLTKLDSYNRNRIEIARYYFDALKNNSAFTQATDILGSIYLRFPVLYKDRDSLISKAKARGILLGNWYHNTVDPAGVALEKIGYRMGSCPNAEDAAARIVNLPTLVTKEQAKRVVGLL